MNFSLGDKWLNLVPSSFSKAQWSLCTVRKLVSIDSNSDCWICRICFRLSTTHLCSWLCFWHWRANFLPFSVSCLTSILILVRSELRAWTLPYSKSTSKSYTMCAHICAHACWILYVHGTSTYIIFNFYYSLIFKFLFKSIQLIS